VVAADAELAVPAAAAASVITVAAVTPARSRFRFTAQFPSFEWSTGALFRLV
jgi:hypothetical protein